MTTRQDRLPKETRWAPLPSLTALWYNMRARRYPGLGAYAALSACSFSPSSLFSLTWLITLQLRPRFDLYANNLQFLAAARIELPPSPISFYPPCFKGGASYGHFRKFATGHLWHQWSSLNLVSGRAGIEVELMDAQWTV